MVSGGILADNWKEILDGLAKECRERNGSYASFSKRVLNGIFDDKLTCACNRSVSDDERREIREYLETISW